MSAAGTVKQVLKRGALVTAANWQVVVIQFVADALFKTLLAVPLVGGVVLGALLVGGDPAAELFALDWRHAVPAIASLLVAQPIAFAAFLLALGVTVAGGALLMFLVKGGAMYVLLEGDQRAGAIEQLPLRASLITRAGAFSLERFSTGARVLFGRYLRLGLSLCGVYALSAATYLVVVFGPRAAGRMDWPLVAGVASLVLVAWITFVNFLYLQFQILIAALDCDIATAIRHVAAWLRTEARLIALVFGAILVLVTLTFAASILATAALGLIAFVPLVGLAALPLQLVAWLLRGMVFQYIGLSGLVAYARLHRAVLERSAAAAAARSVHHVNGVA